MSMSEWSSDVCSSDLPPRPSTRKPDAREHAALPEPRGQQSGRTVEDQQGEEHEEIEDREAEKLARRAVASAAISAAQHDAGQQDEAEPHRRGDGTVDDSSGEIGRAHA